MKNENQGSRFDLTEGSIIKKLFLVAIPIMGGQIVQMTYNLTDMFWLGRLSSHAVAASGTVGMYLWLSNAFFMFGRMGAEIGVAQNLGKRNPEKAKTFAQSSIVINFMLGILYGLFLLIGNRFLVGLFNIPEANVVQLAQDYLIIVGIGIPFTFITSAVTGIFNGSGNSATPFTINAIGLVTNIILDPLLIFRFDMGIKGAALATIIAQILACILSVLALLFYKHRPFEKISLFVLPTKDILQQIFKWATPVAVESFFFTTLTMIISRFVATWGADAMTTQRISSQIESLSWLIAGGFSSALTAFIGQNYGAKKWDRIHSGFFAARNIMIVWGLITTLILYFGGGKIFALFLPNEPKILAMGVVYLKILAVCQLIACLEGVASGFFRGMGRTAPPSIVSTVCNALRVVAAYFLSQTSLGLEGIWWAVSLGAAVRGLWLYLWYRKTHKKNTARIGETNI